MLLLRILAAKAKARLSRRWGGGGGARDGMVACKPLDFEKPVRLRMGLLIGAVSSYRLTSVSRSLK